ncbi:MAG: hypothetical protein GX369_01515 [Euryarchaeota archaeon]|nr:hypothetical protein [Euryarchaeota archaeon]
MKVNVDLSLMDMPGQLIRALEPISANNGNVIGVIHDHEAIVGGRITVNVTFEVHSDLALENILATWKENDVIMIKMDAVFESYPLQYLLVGDISSKEIESLTHGMESMEGLASMDIRITGSLTSGSRAAMVTGRVTRHGSLETVEQFFRQHADNGGYMLIRGLE